jgi:hypothetical protein
MLSVNDTARCERNEFVEDELTLGKVYTVVGADLHDKRVKVLNDEGDKHWYYVDRFVLVTNTPRPLATTVLPPSQLVRTFATGATRDLDANKLDFEGFLSPLVLEEFAKYMHEKRKMPDGSMRDSDNWQKGIPLDAYMKSMFRHFFAVWKSHRAGTVSREDMMGLLFNVQGYIHETLKAGK